MKKLPYKVVVSAALATLMMTASIAPNYASAAAPKQQTTAPIQVATAPELPAKYLGPDGLKQALVDSGSNVMVMDAYALTLLKQYDPNFDALAKVQGIGDKVTQLKAMNDKAKANAKEWLDVIKPQLIQTNENTRAFASKFDSYYTPLVKAVQTNNKASFIKGVELLDKQLEANRIAVENIIKDKGVLPTYRDKLTEDYRSYESQANALAALAASKEAGIPSLKKEVEMLNDAIETHMNNIVYSSVGLGLSGLAIFGGVVLIATGVGAGAGKALVVIGVAGAITSGTILGTSVAALNKSRDQLAETTKNITALQSDVVVLTFTKDQFGKVKETIDLALTSLNKIHEKWQSMHAKYNTLLNQVRMMTPQQFDEAGEFLEADLEITRKEWQEVHEMSKSIYKDINYTVKQ